MTVHKSVSELIGGTPLVELTNYEKTVSYTHLPALRLRGPAILIGHFGDALSTALSVRPLRYQTSRVFVQKRPGFLQRSRLRLALPAHRFG